MTTKAKADMVTRLRDMVEELCEAYEGFMLDRARKLVSESTL